MHLASPWAFRQLRESCRTLLLWPLRSPKLTYLNKVSFKFGHVGLALSDCLSQLLPFDDKRPKLAFQIVQHLYNGMDKLLRSGMHRARAHMRRGRMNCSSWSLPVHTTILRSATSSSWTSFAAGKKAFTVTHLSSSCSKVAGSCVRALSCTLARSRLPTWTVLLVESFSRSSSLLRSSIFSIYCWFSILSWSKSTWS